MSSPGYSSARLRPRRAGLRFIRCTQTTNGPIQQRSVPESDTTFLLLPIGPVHRKPAEEVRRFGTNVRDLEAMRAWLLEKACTEVVMESTGSYWRPVFNILEGDVQVILANPEQVKALRGKKTDRKDCRWLAGLLRHGLVQASFIPPRDIRELRDLTRRRRKLLENGT